MKTVLSLLAGCGLALPGAAAPPPLDLPSVRARALEDPGVARLKADLAERRRQLAATGGLLREGPLLGVEAGPRRVDEGATQGDLALEAEVPLRLRGGVCAEAAARVDEAGPVLVAAALAEADGRLVSAYADAWLAASRVEALSGQLSLLEEWREVARRRVEAGADAPFQLSLVEGDLLRARADLDRARREAAEAWGALRALAGLPASPGPLASPPTPAWPEPGEARARFEKGLALAAIEARFTLDRAFAALEAADRGERWGLRASVAKEGADGVARAGLSYRFPLPGERSAGDEASRTREAGLRRDTDSGRSLLETRFEGTLERVRAFGPAADAKVFEDALAAVGLRVAEGKDRPSDAVLVRRQLVDARLAALERARDAVVLSAELETLTKGTKP